VFFGEKLALLLSLVGVIKIVGRLNGVTVESGVKVGPTIVAVFFCAILGMILLSVIR
jgi:hypothetical protein